MTEKPSERDKPCLGFVVWSRQPCTDKTLQVHDFQEISQDDPLLILNSNSVYCLETTKRRHVSLQSRVQCPINESHHLIGLIPKGTESSHNYSFGLCCTGGYNLCLLRPSDSVGCRLPFRDNGSLVVYTFRVFIKWDYTR